MKKLLSVILSFVMIIACIPLISFAADSDDVKSLYEYEINDGEVTITKYIGNETDVDIPSEIEGFPVTAIGEKAFFECTILESVSIPDSVNSIGKYAFYMCNKLEQVTLSNSIEVISVGSFKYCRALRNINIPENLKDIKGESFTDCINLQSITIPASVKSISGGAFDGSKISKLYISDLEAWLSVDLGYDSPMYASDAVYINGELAETIVIPDSITEIKPYAFYGCKTIENVTIPGSIESIKGNTFAGCNSLKNVIISEGVKSIGANAFGSSETCFNVVLPSSIENLGFGAFGGVYRILYLGSSEQWAEVNIEEDPYATSLDTPNWVLIEYYRELGLSGITEDGFVYSVSDTSEVTIRSVLNSSDNIIIPETIEGLPVVAIGDRAFMSVTATNLHIHSGIKDLSDYSFYQYKYGYDYWKAYTYRADFKNIYYEGSPGMLNSLGAGNLSNSYNVIGNYEPIVGFALADGKSEITLSIGDTFEPVYEVYPENAKGVFDYSFDSDCITIKNGVITGVNPGETTVTVTAESGVKYTFAVKVIGAVGISVMNPPSKTYYGLRESLDVEGLKIIKQYNDGTSVELTDYTLSSFNPLQRGLQTITVTGEGFTTSFNVFVSGATVGDIDLDENITSIDSNLMKRIIAGEMTLDEFTDEYFACDLNGDGKINAVDSALLKQKLAG